MLEEKYYYYRILGKEYKKYFYQRNNTKRTERLNLEGKKSFKLLYQNDTRNYLLYSGQPD